MKSPIALVQLNCVWEDKPANYARVHSLVASAEPEAGSLIVLPEMFATGFSNNLSVTVESEEGPTLQFLRALAAAHDCTVIGGVVTPGKNGSKGRNQAVAVSPAREVLSRYTKMQPFSLGGETSCHEKGAGPVIFDWRGFKVAPLICYDLRFPEIAREAVRLGAEILVYIASWPIKRQQHWITLLQARAIENLAYVIGVNRCGSDPEFVYSGRSVVVDPHGIIMADAAEQERVVTAGLEVELVRAWREQFPALRDAGLA